MVATETYTVKPPKRVSAFLAERARNERMTIQDVIIMSLEEYMGMVEDLRLSEMLAGREATRTELMPHGESWKMASESSFDEDAFANAVEEGTELWRDVPDHVAWVRDVRGVPHG